VRTFKTGVVMAIVAFIMTLVGIPINFSVNLGAIYYSIAIALGVASAFVIPIGWGQMASKC